MNRSEKAVALFESGYNCAQAVFVAFADVVGMDEEAALRLSSSFGGGVGRQREVCGAVSGMCMVAGALFGYDDVTDPKVKTEHYALIQEMCGKFREAFGSIVCRELLGAKTATTTPVPSARTPEYYATRPCAKFVGMCADILGEYIKE